MFYEKIIRREKIRMKWQINNHRKLLNSITCVFDNGYVAYLLLYDLKIKYVKDFKKKNTEKQIALHVTDPPPLQKNIIYTM